MLRHRGEPYLAVLPFKSPYLVKDGIVPLLRSVGDTKGLCQVGDFAVMPADQNDLARIFAVEYLAGESRCFVVFKHVIDLEMEGLRERRDGLDRAV